MTALGTGGLSLVGQVVTGIGGGFLAGYTGGKTTKFIAESRTIKSKMRETY